MAEIGLGGIIGKRVANYVGTTQSTTGHDYYKPDEYIKCITEVDLVNPTVDAWTNAVTYNSGPGMLLFLGLAFNDGTGAIGEGGGIRIICDDVTIYSDTSILSIYNKTGNEYEIYDPGGYNFRRLL